MTVYCDDGRFNMSNALAENAIRPFAVGRRNWLFADTPRGAKALATVYSLIETTKANQLEPFAYIRHVLRHIAGADTAEKLEALLPWNIERGILQRADSFALTKVWACVDNGGDAYTGAYCKPEGGCFP